VCPGQRRRGKLGTASGNVSCVNDLLVPFHGRCLVNKCCPLCKGRVGPLVDVHVMDHLAGGTAGAMAPNTLAGSTKVHRGVGLIDCGHHVDAHIDEGPGEIVGRWCSGIGLASTLVLGVKGDKAPARCIRAGEVLGSLVELGPGGLGLVSLEGGARGYCPSAAFECVESSDAVVEDFEGLMELVVGDLVELVIGEQEGIIRMAQWVREQDAELVEHLDDPEDQWLGC